jgi:hypothetical protein
MNFQSKFDIGEVVFLKSSTGVSKGTIVGITLDVSKQTHDSFTFAYLIWESDREDNAGHHIWVYECNIGRTFDEAYYKASKRFPWDISEDFQKKDMELYLAKCLNQEHGLTPQIS